MNPRAADPIGFFNRWFRQPLSVADRSIAGTIEALNRHPLANDESAQDYVMPLRRCRERAGRFRIYGENQDTYYCFVYEGEETKTDAPVYLESCLDLRTDYGIDEGDIIEDDHVLIADTFTDFLWHMLGFHAALRMESGGQFVDGVSGIVFDDAVQIDDAFVNPLGRDFPAGYTVLLSDDVVCIVDWGASFRTPQARESFIRRYSPRVRRSWT